MITKCSMHGRFYIEMSTLQLFRMANVANSVTMKHLVEQKIHSVSEPLTEGVQI